MDIILLIFAVIFFGSFLIVPIVKTFFDDKLNNEEEKRKYLLEQITEDSVKQILDLESDDSFFKETYVERPIKETGEWSVYVIIGYGYQGNDKHSKVFSIKDSDLSKIISN